MRYFSFKILFFCILLPPILYIVSIQSVERYIDETYAVEMENEYLGDTALLLNGSKRLQDSIHDNINRYLQNKILNSSGVKIDITVSTKKGRLIYPGIFEDEPNSYITPDSTVIASENYKLMNEGLTLKLDAKVEHNKFLSNGILAGLIVISLVVLYLHYRSVTYRIEHDELEKSREMSRLLELEAHSNQKLKNLDREQAKLTAELSRLKATLEDQKNKATRNEDELFDELEVLEGKFDANLSLQVEQQQEIGNLKEQLRQYETEKLKVHKKKTKAIQIAGKRFETLYKNLKFADRAFEGFIELNEDLKIKAEEMIQLLNHDPGQVSIKRKVFIGKRDKKNIMEVIFGYKGRLYFRNLKDSRIEVLAIGTKNTQAREIEFLNKL